MNDKRRHIMEVLHSTPRMGVSTSFITTRVWGACDHHDWDQQAIRRELHRMEAEGLLTSEGNASTRWWTLVEVAA